METPSTTELQALHSNLQPWLSGREELIWVGQPWQGLRLYKDDWLLIPGLVIPALIIGTIGIILWSAPFLLAQLIAIATWAIAFYMVFGRFLLDAYIRSRTIYGITNRRIIIYKKGTKEAMSVALGSLKPLRVLARNDQYGTIFLPPNDPAMVGLIYNHFPPFIPDYTENLVMIPNAQRVYELIQDIRLT
jgi:hypothetical protein